MTSDTPPQAPQPAPQPAEPDKKPSGWSAVASNFAGIDRDTLLGTLGRILRAPIQGPVDLALRDSYGGHLKLFATVVAGTYGVVFVTVPNMAAQSLGREAIASPSQTVLFMTVQYAMLMLSLPLSYYAFRRAGAAERTPMSYYKLTLLAAAASSLVFFVAFYGLSVLWALWTLEAEDTREDLARVLRWLLTTASVVSILYVSAVHARFWEVRWLWAALAFFAMWVPTSYVSMLLFRMFSSAAQLAPGLVR